jgi:signal transduction histidine kinase
MIANLIDNAIRHNTPGGHVEITTGTRDRHAFVTIANTGPTIPATELQRLFEPFQRLDGARTRHNNGHGIGLSIVQSIATAHHAELGARARPAGGLTIDISFPPATRDHSGLTPATARTKPGGRGISETDVPARG